MPVLELPDRASLENLRKQAKTLQRLVRAGVGGALDTVAEFHPRLGSRPASSPAATIPASGSPAPGSPAPGSPAPGSPAPGSPATTIPAPGSPVASTLTPGDPLLGAFSLADAQLVIARQYGFPSWPRLRQYLADVAEFSRSPHQQPTGGPASADQSPAGLADDFVRLACLVYDGYDAARVEQAERILAEHPEVAVSSPYTAAAAGEHDHLSKLLRADPALVGRQGGPFGWPPLLYACYSRVSPEPGRSTLQVARRLLATGADPNAGYLWSGLPSPFTALTGAFGRGEGAPPAHPQASTLATLLLEAGADPNDSQALYNCGLQSPPDDDAYLRLLLRFGLGTGSGGPWHQRLAPVHDSPRQLLDQELIKAVRKDLPGRVRLLLAHGADPAGFGTGRSGHTAWEWAALGGDSEIQDLLATAGPAPGLDPVLAFLSACMAGDAARVAAARAADPGIAAEAIAREPDMLAEAAAADRPAAVRLLAQAGYDVNAPRGAGYTALHGAAANGSLSMVRTLLELGADPALEDRVHHGTAQDWAEYHDQPEVAAYLAAYLARLAEPPG